MSNPAPQLAQELWNYCNILRDDGLSYSDYVEQLTSLLFLKIADEPAKPLLSLARVTIYRIMDGCTAFCLVPPHDMYDIKFL